MRRAVGIAVALLSAAVAAAESDLERVQRAVAYTLSTQQPNGLFAYDFDFLAAEPSGQDNIVRQAGTLFALGEYLTDTGDASVAPALRAGLEALEERSLPVGTGRVQAWLERAGVFGIDSGRLERLLGERGWLYAPEGPGALVSGDGSYAQALVGATALGLIAELHYAAATADERFAPLRERWLRGLLSLWVPGRGMRMQPTLLRQSPYVDGETWLALAVYHERFPADADAARVLAELEDYAIARYGARASSHFFHWGALASAARLATGDAARLVAFSERQAESVLAERPVKAVADTTTCSFIEGLASSIAVLGARPDGREALLGQLRDRVAIELARNRPLQIQPGQQEIALPEGGLLRAPGLARHAGAFRAGRYGAYTRTDLTQHCISGFLKARRVGLADAVPAASVSSDPSPQ